MRKLLVSVVTVALLAGAIAPANAKSLAGAIYQQAKELRVPPELAPLILPDGTTVVVDHGMLPPPSVVVVPKARISDEWVAYAEPREPSFDLARVGVPSYQIPQIAINIGSIAYIATADGGALLTKGNNLLLRVDVSDPNTPLLTGQLSIPGVGFSIVVDGTRAYIGVGTGGKAGEKAGLCIVDLTTMQFSFFEVNGGDWTAPNNCRILEVKGGIVKISYLFTSQRGGERMVDAIINCTDPASPRRIE
ncbi:hypothetical protein CVV26_01355 [Candidatus Kuenenbacteria bacterium HGW-Kuenenbacteria-1]|uniref:Uncharacterized protein n=1 Tax=Candidatus Kuenenbacteria bacterium HGW-Kuenenbacteria-1 TaxID=2013812 RepID=A0A2N1UNM3_9BACT|nr:MAG: hypothetical protein CVV26_01355 [Candidatus Kuenenbacteria bacterium HGW-Kuenenbacteria-1]